MSKKKSLDLGKLIDTVKRSHALILVSLSTLFFFILSVGSIQNSSATIDEKFHFTRGVMLLKTGDYRINQHHPILFNTLTATPALLNDHLQIPKTEGNQNWEEARKDELSFEMVARNGGIIKFSESILKPSRYLMIVFSTLFIPAFYLVTKKYFSVGAAIISTLFLLLSPTFIAHGRLVTTDVPSAVMIFLTTFYLAFLLRSGEKPKLSALVGFGLLAVATLLTKYTAVMLLPVWFIGISYLLLRGTKLDKKTFVIGFGKSLGFFLLLFFIIFLAYGARFGTIREMSYGHSGKQEGFEKVYEGVGDRFGRDSFVYNMVEFTIEDLKLPAPQYINGFIENVLVHNTTGHDAFLLGESSSEGWKHYFIVAFLLKETLSVIIAFMIIASLNLGNLASKIVKRSLKADELLLIATPTYLFLLSVGSSLNLGVRHLLPVLLFVYVLVGYGLNKLIQKNRALIILPILLISFALLSILSQYPNYISYFNESIGGQENGDKYLRGSNYDWGQNEIYAYNYLLERNDFAENNDGWYQSKNTIVVSKRILESEHERSVFPLVNWIYSKYRDGEIEPIDEIMGTHLVFEIEE